MVISSRKDLEVTDLQVEFLITLVGRTIPHTTPASISWWHVADLKTIFDFVTLVSKFANVFLQVSFRPKWPDSYIMRFE